MLAFGAGAHPTFRFPTDILPEGAAIASIVAVSGADR
jgi:hypothetical protein